MSTEQADLARTGKVREELHKFLIAGEKARRDADYVVSRRVPPGDAEQQIARAERFLAITEDLVGGSASEAAGETGSPPR